ncbi:motility associated factor glycosyltransferase family protein [Caldibacillus debilis]|uniref:motility associated factor glycosyltransferase family protein n=1 Tax=Caldibacillus debilis TaxID=301148 RepID=UPI000B57C51A|nr:6-hydroxymethylpterin diphosphokinase MptE-like protein [Caldibacillus debilis]OUM88230.1 MAG: hypothetical protein BAA03_15020 [Caldibacillus debilis]
MLTDNRAFLKEKASGILERLDAVFDSGRVGCVEAKNGQKTLQIEKNGRMLLVHSGYDPGKEAAMIMERLRGKLKEKEPVIFIGFGLGYHIDAIAERLSPPWFSVIEFSPEVLKAALSVYDIKKRKFFKGLKHLHLIENEEQILPAIVQDVDDVNRPPQLVILPSYERIFKEEVARYLSGFQQYLKEKKSRYVTTLHFEKRWIINSLQNFPSLLKTPNLLADFDRSLFENKPAVLVAAGPSLNEEFDHLKRIKEDRSAYIFSVGSAINALIEHGIYPHAAFTYDPTPHNQFVFQKLKEKGITEIPLVFGSSVGFETLKDYPGKMAHFITSQDWLSAYTLKHRELADIDIAMDSPSIAIITLQILDRLNCNPILLVGQNFSFRERKRYASGIEYDMVDSELGEKEMEGTFETESVDGGKVLTNEGYMQMKKSMEYVLEGMIGKTVYNTTKKGAKIEHTIYRELSSLVDELPKNGIVLPWFTDERPNYDLAFIEEKWKTIVSESESIGEKIDEIRKMTAKIEQTLQMRKLHKMEHLYQSLEGKVNGLQNTLVYKIFLRSMTQIETEIASKEIAAVRNSEDAIKKGQTVVKEYRRLVDAWEAAFRTVKEEIKKIGGEVLAEVQKVG